MSTAPVAIFRVDASEKTGGGHVVRCLALADCLRVRGWHCNFATRTPTLTSVPILADSGHQILRLEGDEDDEHDAIRSQLGAADLAVVDHYGRGRTYENRAREWGRRIFAIDDMPNRPHDADLLLDQTFGRKAEEYADLVPPSAQLLLGSAFALLRPEFAGVRERALARRTSAEKPKRVLVSLGVGGRADLVPRILRAIAETELDVEICLVSGGDQDDEILTAAIAAVPQKVDCMNFATDMAEIMCEADISIGAAGSTTWERCCLGLPGIMLVLADNQERIAEEVGQAGASLIVRDVGERLEATLSEKLSALVEDTDRRLRMVAACAAICDGLGCERVVEEIVAG